MKEKDSKNSEIVVTRKFVKNPPDKIRLIVQTIKGKKINEAIKQLEFSPLYASRPLELVLKSGRAMAKERDFSEENLLVKFVKVDEGPKLKRRRLISKGRSTDILKRMSHITVVLTDNGKSKARSTPSGMQSETKGKQK